MDTASTVADLMRQARREKGLTQSALAREIGCTQSAISMFESGREDALSDETVARIAARLGMTLPSPDEAPVDGHTGQRISKYCPTTECPSNVPYIVRGQICLKPALFEGAYGAIDRCPFCAELLEENCPNAQCGAPVSEGAFCRRCGTPYVAPPAGVEDAASWAERRRQETREVLGLAEELRWGGARKGW